MAEEEHDPQTRERRILLALTNANIAMSNTTIGVRRLAVAQLNAMKDEPEGALKAIRESVDVLTKAEDAMEALTAIIYEMSEALREGK